MPGQSGMARFRPGDSFDGYTVLSKLGEGGFGAVYCVRDGPPGGHMYAAKLEAVTIRTPVLTMEETVLKALNKTNARHFCKLIVKRKQPTFKYINKFDINKKSLDIKTIVECAVSMLQIGCIRTK